MKRWLTHHKYAISVALKRLLAQPFSTLSNLFVISLSLSIPLLAASLLVSLKPVTQQIPIAAQITIFANLETSEQEVENLAEQLNNAHSNLLENIEIVNRDVAISRLKASDTWATALSSINTNPLPHALIIKLKDVPDQATIAHDLAQQWLSLDLVDKVQLDSEWVHRLTALLQFFHVGILILAAIVLLVVLATVFNTVRMQALALRDEISVVRMVGATEAFVRRPFLYLGAITGVISSALALIFTKVALNPLNTSLAKLAQTYNAQITLQLPDTYILLFTVLLVILIASIAARWSVSRHTHQII